ncbi:unnamed protein product, partial [Amoebophrya sp. A120]
ALLPPPTYPELHHPPHAFPTVPPGLYPSPGGPPAPGTTAHHATYSNNYGQLPAWNTHDPDHSLFLAQQRYWLQQNQQTYPGYNDDAAWWAAKNLADQWAKEDYAEQAGDYWAAAAAAGCSKGGPPGGQEAAEEQHWPHTTAAVGGAKLQAEERTSAMKTTAPQKFLHSSSTAADDILAQQLSLVEGGGTTTRTSTSKCNKTAKTTSVPTATKSTRAPRPEEVNIKNPLLLPHPPGLELPPQATAKKAKTKEEKSEKKKEQTRKSSSPATKTNKTKTTTNQTTTRPEKKHSKGRPLKTEVKADGVEEVHENHTKPTSSRELKNPEQDDAWNYMEEQLQQ